MATKAELEQELRILKAQHEQFKEQVKDVARRVKDEEGWCDSGFAEVMNELGLEAATHEVKVVITYTAQVSAIDESHLNPDYIERSLVHKITSSIQNPVRDGTFELDEDFITYDTGKTTTTVSVFPL